VQQKHILLSVLFLKRGYHSATWKQSAHGFRWLFPFFALMQIFTGAALLRRWLLDARGFPKTVVKLSAMTAGG